MCILVIAQRAAAAAGSGRDGLQDDAAAQLPVRLFISSRWLPVANRGWRWSCSRGTSPRRAWSVDVVHAAPARGTGRRLPGRGISGRRDEPVPELRDQGQSRRPAARSAWSGRADRRRTRARACQRAAAAELPAPNRAPSLVRPMMARHQRDRGDDQPGEHGQRDLAVSSAVRELGGRRDRRRTPSGPGLDGRGASEAAGGRGGSSRGWLVASGRTVPEGRPASGANLSRAARSSAVLVSDYPMRPGQVLRGSALLDARRLIDLRVEAAVSRLGHDSRLGCGPTIGSWLILQLKPRVQSDRRVLFRPTVGDD